MWFNWYAYLFSYYLKTRLLNIKEPFLAGIKITHACNLACKHCPFWKKGQRDLSFLQVKESLKQLYKLGARVVIIEGGEPFLWKDGNYDIRDIVEEAKKFFLSVGITTNGTFPLAVNADIIWVSIDGLKQKHDQLRGESFEKIMNNLKNSTHPAVYAHITINSFNKEEVPELVKFLTPIVKGITVQFHYPYEGIADELFVPLKNRPILLDNLIKMKRDGFPLANSYACLRALKANRWKCYPWMIASVDPDGKITQGCYLKTRGEICCEKCGFSAHTEISLTYRGIIEAVFAGNRIFAPQRRIKINAPG